MYTILELSMSMLHSWFSSFVDYKCCIHNIYVDQYGGLPTSTGGKRWLFTIMKMTIKIRIISYLSICKGYKHRAQKDCIHKDLWFNRELVYIHEREEMDFYYYENDEKIKITHYLSITIYIIPHPSVHGQNYQNTIYHTGVWWGWWTNPLKTTNLL